MFSPALWTSIATGKERSVHNINTFYALDETTKHHVPITSNFRKAKAIWQIVSDMGGRVGNIGWWASYPPDEVDGYSISDRLFLKDKTVIYPQSDADVLQHFARVDRRDGVE